MKRLIFLICLTSIFQIANSQSKVVDFLVGGKNDANALVKGYLTPYASAFGDGLNNGWYNSAETHKLFGFDINFSVSAIQIPARDRTFDLNEIGLTKLTLENPAKHLAPTVAGGKGEIPVLQVHDLDGNVISTFTTPEGTGYDILPVPMAQIGFGILPHTELIGRFVPKMKYNNNGDEMQFGFFGLGVKHNFKEWIPVLKTLPFDASIFGSFSKINAQSEISFDPSDFSEGNVTVTFDKDKQVLEFDTKTTKVGLILSKKIGVLTVFGGIGHSSSETSIDLLGKYIIETEFTSNGKPATTKDELNDPISVRFSNNNLSMDAGLRLKLAFFSLFASVNRAEYTSYNAGISMGYR